jgi:hypothetical protein
MTDFNVEKESCPAMLYLPSPQMIHLISRLMAGPKTCTNAIMQRLCWHTNTTQRCAMRTASENMQRFDDTDEEFTTAPSSEMVSEAEYRADAPSLRRRSSHG